MRTKGKKMKELITEAKIKNDERSPDEVDKFFWKVIDMRIKKWWLKDTDLNIQ